MVFWFGSYFEGFMEQAITDARTCELHKGLHPDFVRWNYMQMALPQFYAVMTDEYFDRVTGEKRNLLNGAWRHIGVWKNVIADEVVSGIEGLRRAQDFGSYTLPVEERPGKRAKKGRSVRSPPRADRKGRRSGSPQTDSRGSSDSDDAPEDRRKSARRPRSPQRHQGPGHTSTRGTHPADKPTERRSEPAGGTALCLEWAIENSKLPRKDGLAWRGCPHGSGCRFSHQGVPPRTLDALLSLIEKSPKSADWKSATRRQLTE